MVAIAQLDTVWDIGNTNTLDLTLPSSVSSNNKGGGNDKSQSLNKQEAQRQLLTRLWSSPWYFKKPCTIWVEKH